MATETVDELGSQERREIARGAAYDIEHLAEAVSAAAREDVVIRTLALRIVELAGIVMSAVDDASEQTPRLWEKLNAGPRAEASNG